MVFQSYGFESNTYSPINMGHASVSAPMTIGAGGAGCGSKKRKTFDEMDSFASGAEYHIRPKLSLPRSAGLVFNADAQFHPLPADVNQAMLAQLGHSPFANGASSSASSTFVTPSSSSSSGFGHEHKSSNGSDYFSTAAPNRYPDVEPYPSTSPSSTYGILGPAPGRHNSLSDGDGMEVDYGSNPSVERVHGPQCKSIPQLCVRYNDGAGSELWATCPDCGACSKVESNQPSQLCYSP
ncbi:Glycogen synthase [Pseudozyma hubeiensis]|nr:Glycogen synthase [Pseudozyma hubeiensis]